MSKQDIERIMNDSVGMLIPIPIAASFRADGRPSLVLDAKDGFVLQVGGWMGGCMPRIQLAGWAGVIPCACRRHSTCTRTARTAP